MQITLANPKEIVVRPAETKTLSILTINRLVDLPQMKIVKCFIDELSDPVTLWEGADYDTIGQWKDTDVIEKINSLYNH